VPTSITAPGDLRSFNGRIYRPGSQR